VVPRVIPSFEHNFWLCLKDGIFYSQSLTINALWAGGNSPMAGKSDNDAMTEAIEALRAGVCRICGKQRVESKTEESAGFGQGTRTVTRYICGNPDCPNKGNPWRRFVYDLVGRWPYQISSLPHLSKNMIKIITIKKLKAHEKTDGINFAKVKKAIRQKGYFTKPIIVDDKNFIILDGHHRTKALLNLGYKKIPALLVDYQNPKIKVVGRRKNIKINKRIVIKNALAKKLFPYKTSKHLVPNRPAKFEIKLEKLQWKNFYLNQKPANFGNYLFK